jgi:hypothetical protein
MAGNHDLGLNVLAHVDTTSILDLKYLVVLWFTRGFLAVAGYSGALRTTLVIEPSIFIEGDLA